MDEKFLVCQNFTCDISLNFLNFHIEVHLLRQIYFTIIRYKIVSNNNIKNLLVTLKKVLKSIFPGNREATSQVPQKIVKICENRKSEI